MTEIKDLSVVETRKLASFRAVDAIEPIEGADAIELAVIGGWKVVTKKGEFQPGDPCVYFEIDSFMPDGVPAWQFLVDKSARIFNGVKGHKLRTIKLRGQISQGLILPTRAHPATQLVLSMDEAAFAFNALTCTEAEIAEAKYLRFGMNEHSLDPRDLNLNKLLGIVKWEPLMSAQLAGMAEGLFPNFIRKTDQERAQNLKDEIFGFEDIVIPANEELGRPEIVRRAKGDLLAKYEITLKFDGSSMTVFARLNGENHDQIESGVCSRNLQLKVNEANVENSFIKLALKSGLLAALEDMARDGIGNLAVQGELMGPGIQSNREELKDFVLYIFEVQALDTGDNLTPDERHGIFRELYNRGVNPDMVRHVPVIAHGANLLDTLGITTMEQLLKFAEGPSIVHPIREGLVFKRHDGRFSFKVINQQYLLKEKD